MSASCFPILSTGFKEENGSCITMAISLPLILLIWERDSCRRSFPAKKMLPDTEAALSGNSPIIAFAVTLFPHPDSPAIASVSLLFSSKLTFLTTVFLSNEIVRLDTFNTAKPYLLPKYFGPC